MAPLPERFSQETTFSSAKQPGNKPWTITIVHPATGTVAQGVNDSYLLANDQAVQSMLDQLAALA